MAPGTVRSTQEEANHPGLVNTELESLICQGEGHRLVLQ